MTAHARRLAALVVLAFAVSAAAADRGTTVRITKEDLLATPEGQRVKALNDELREYQEESGKLTKGSRPYDELKAKFESLKAERDRAGEPIRGLLDRELVVHGKDAAGLKAKVIAQARVDAAFRARLSSGGQHVWMDASGRLQLSNTAPAGKSPPAVILAPNQGTVRPQGAHKANDCCQNGSPVFMGQNCLDGSQPVHPCSE